MRESQFYIPSEIERETGFGKEQLRKWRQRFGFPPKESNLTGVTAYSLTTVNQLLLIKRLLEAGLRPAQVVGKSIVELERLKLGMGLNIQAGACKLFCVNADGTLIGDRAADHQIQ